MPEWVCVKASQALVVALQLSERPLLRGSAQRMPYGFGASNELCTQLLQKALKAA